MSSPPLLSTSALTKEYSTRVLDQVDFEVVPGEIHGLLGANGAGKSTLCRILAGLVPATSGTMQLQGQPFAPATKQAAEKAGVQIVQQELNLVPTLSVAENLFLNRLPQQFGIIQQQKLHRLARHALDRLDLREIDTHTKVASLGVGQQQMVEIAAALDRDCKLLILDEPTAALSATETSRLFQWLKQLKTAGVGMIYISHRLTEVLQITDRVTVLRDGKKVATTTTSELTSQRLVEQMSGSAAARNTKERISNRQDSLAMQVKGFTRLPSVKNISFAVHRGECLGISGLVGAGRTELLRCLFGADQAQSGELFLGDKKKPLRFQHPSQAVANGLVMVTEDRKQDGLLLSQSIRVNTTLTKLSGISHGNWFVDAAQENHAVQKLHDDLDIRSTGIEQAVGTLSGGNQQKVAVAKWLFRDGDVFLFDEPTRGIDMAARRRIYDLFIALTAQGKALVIVSSDVEELMEVCDRIAVMSAGKWVAEFERPEFSEEALTQAAFSGFTSAES